jgi:hypothetical protein
MSLLSVRQEIATALSTVTGVTGYTDPPGVMAPGGAWPLLTSLTTADHLPAGLFLAQWRVLLITGGTPEDALTWLDGAAFPLVLAALAPHGWITQAQPVTIATPSSGTLYGVEITLVRE